jgi:TRAP-type mannitol/chloroaromatic compound transport system permease small subunit
MARVEQWLKKIDAINEWVGKTIAFGLIPITLIAMTEVVMRYIFNRPTIWAWDINVQLGGLLIIMGAGYTFLHGQHVIVDIVVERFSIRQRAWIDLVTACLFFLACIVLIRKSSGEAWTSLITRERSSSFWGPPIYPLKMLMPVGAFLLLLQGAAKFIRDLSLVINPQHD